MNNEMLLCHVFFALASAGHSCARDTTLLVKVGVFDMHQSVHVFLKKGRLADIRVMKLAD